MNKYILLFGFVFSSVSFAYCDYETDHTIVQGVDGAIDGAVIGGVVGEPPLVLLLAEGPVSLVAQ
ncbi:hypothetical protein [Agarivorans sp. Toyoura001]|uniref:hypothetical protein n=1 Tax=unclassified Agarivorans TaxID=2636026 RepID=UPI0010E9E3A1|nr:hypothetical protein [Agarivorans sp. Toyoura001]GDY24702.1 hypothetical protein AHAT_05920 [Agarivorans sp. Toyoura001]